MSYRAFIGNSPLCPWIVNHSTTCKVSVLYLGNCANTYWIYVFWIINPLFLSPWGYHRIANPSTTCPGELLTYLWSFSSVSWKLWERMLNFSCLSDQIFISEPPGASQNRQPLHDLSRRVADVPVKFQLCILKTVRMHVEFTFLSD